MMKNINIIKFM